MSITPSPKLTLGQLYHHLAATLGPSGWWPADSPYEILVGAILVQNTNWSNVDKSLANLRQATHFDPTALAALTVDNLQALIRPSGFYVHKSQAIQALFGWLATQQWDLSGLSRRTDLRRTLLALPGIGPETADAMRLYVFGQPTFVADHYSRRLFQWLGQPAMTYPQLKACTTAVDNWPLPDAQELHGLIDNFGKIVKSPAAFAQSSLANAQLQL